jgi:CubicO group peptidase (beta-lactamase class C family)
MSDLEKNLMELLSPWQDIPGVAVCIVVHDQEPVFACAGYSNLEYCLRIDQTTRFNIASVSKQFTGFAALLLEEQGLLQLDDPLRKHLPDLPPAYQDIQIHHLLHHTSGFRDMYNLQAYAGFRRDDIHTHQQLLTLTGRLSELNFTPGERFNYNNTGYIIMAEIIHKLTGMTMRQFLEVEVFKPLGMADTSLSDNHKEMLPNFAGHYNLMEDGSYTKAFENVSVSGSTNIITSIADFARWLSNYTTSHYQPSVMHRMNTTHPLNDGSTNPYACGLELSERAGKKMWTHGGGAGGFRSEMIFVPEDCVAVGVLSNNGSMDALTLGSRVLGLVLPELAPESRAAAVLKSVAFSESEGKDLPGCYRLPDGLLVTVAAEEDKLFVQTPFYPTRLPLVKTGSNLYRIEVLNADLVPEFDQHQRVCAFNSSTPLGAMRAIKLPPAQIDPQVMREYAGRYFNEKLLNMWEVIHDNGNLTIFHPHFPQIKLVPVLEDEFSSDTENFDRIKFIRGAHNQVVGLEFSSDRAFNIRFNKVREVSCIQ